MKKILSFVLSIVLLLPSIGYVKAAEANKTGPVYSDATHDGFNLSWTNHGERDILLSATNANGTISFQYDERDLRTSKTNATGETTYFTYDDANTLTVVQFGTHRLEYTYDAKRKLIAVTIDGISYRCELLDTSVYRLLDAEGNVAVEYQYEDGFVIAVYGRNNNGEMVNCTNDKDFIGNLNHVTYNSYYYDEETGWYYCGRYYDAVNERFIDGISAESREKFQQQAGNSRMDETSIRARAHTLYNMYINDTEFGEPINDTSSNWYNGMHVPEILARLIYGENPFYGIPASEQIGIAWVLWNRKMSGYGNDHTLFDVATHPTEFSAICDASEQSRKPNITTMQWKTAVLYACYLYCAETTNLENPTARLNAVMPLPFGMTSNHIYFYDYDTAMAMLQNGTTLRLAVIAGYGSIGSTPASLESNYLDYDEAFYEEEGFHLLTQASSPTEDVNGYYEKVNIFYCD